MKKTALLLCVLLAFSQLSQARPVKGKVHCGNDPLSGVIVTDGVNFTRTDSKGTFRLDIEDDAWNVYIVTPRGYTADYTSGSVAYYRPADSKTFDFDLIKTSDSGDYTLFSISDPQCKTIEHYYQFIGDPMADLVAQSAKYSSENTTVAVMLGDIGWDSMWILPMMKMNFARMGIPVYTVIGNHDFDKEKKGRETAHGYCDVFGPYNWAAFVGDGLVIGLKDIIYDTQKKYIEGYTDEELNFVKNLLKYIPEDMHIFVAGHSPISTWTRKYNFVVNGREMVKLLEGRNVDFISGHTHFMNNYRYTSTISEHNAASICGTWWVSKACRDGVPSGYEIFSERDGKLSWFYHPIYGEGDDHQMTVIPVGRDLHHPNYLIANIWDYDSTYTVKWTVDGKDMGKPKIVKTVDPDAIVEVNAGGKKIHNNIHYFAVEPDPYFKTAVLTVTTGFGKTYSDTVTSDQCFDIQAHRGGAGYYPENTVTAFINAEDIGVNTLEMDLQVTSDGKVVVNHDAYMNARYSIRPDGSQISAHDPKEYIYTMPYDEVRKYEVGMTKTDRWPDQKKVSEHRPLVSDVIDTCEAHAAAKGYSPMRYNIEIKSRAGEGEGKNWPEYHEFADKCMEVLLSKGLGDRLLVQCFDVRTLKYLHEKYPQVRLAYLVENDEKFDEAIEGLGFTPDVYSPEYDMVDDVLVKACHDKGIKIVPWTVDDPTAIKAMYDYKVDGIISNYPERVSYVVKGFTASSVF